MNNGNNKLAEIASIFGVSSVTVSNAINRRKNVSQAKAKLIRKYASEIGYHPSLLAQSLLKGKTNIIGLCLKSDLTNPWYSYILKMLQEKMWERNYFLSIFVAYPDMDRIKSGLKFFARLHVDALLIGPMGFMDEYCELEKSLRPFNKVIVFDAEEKLPLDTLQVDTYGAAKIAIEHLVKCGHRRIGMLGACCNEIAMPALKARYQGFVETLRQHELDINSSWILNRKDGQMTSDMSIWLKQVLSDKNSAPTAFYCHNDDIATTAVRILSRLGFKVPGDISLIGTDNHPITEQMPISLTTVGFDLDRYTSKMADMFMDSLSKNNESHKKRILHYIEPPQLFERESVKVLKNN